MVSTKPISDEELAILDSIAKVDPEFESYEMAGHEYRALRSRLRESESELATTNERLRVAEDNPKLRIPSSDELEADYQRRQVRTLVETLDKLSAKLKLAEDELETARKVVDAAEALRSELELAEPSQAPTHYNVWYLFTGALEAHRNTLKASTNLTDEENVLGKSGLTNMSKEREGE